MSDEKQNIEIKKEKKFSGFSWARLRSEWNEAIGRTNTSDVINAEPPQVISEVAPPVLTTTPVLQRLRESASKAADSVSATVSEVRQKFSKTQDDIAETAAEVPEIVVEEGTVVATSTLTQRLRESVSDVVDSTGAKFSRAADSVSATVSEVRERFRKSNDAGETPPEVSQEISIPKLLPASPEDIAKQIAEENEAAEEAEKVRRQQERERLQKEKKEREDAETQQKLKDQRAYEIRMSRRAQFDGKAEELLKKYSLELDKVSEENSNPQSIAELRDALNIRPDKFSAELLIKLKVFFEAAGVLEKVFTSAELDKVYMLEVLQECEPDIDHVDILILDFVVPENSDQEVVKKLHETYIAQKEYLAERAEDLETMIVRQSVAPAVVPKRMSLAEQISEKRQEVAKLKTIFLKPLEEVLQAKFNLLSSEGEIIDRTQNYKVSYMSTEDEADKKRILDKASRRPWNVGVLKYLPFIWGATKALKEEAKLYFESADYPMPFLRDEKFESQVKIRQQGYVESSVEQQKTILDELSSRWWNAGILKYFPPIAKATAALRTKFQSYFDATLALKSVREDLNKDTSEDFAMHLHSEVTYKYEQSLGGTVDKFAPVFTAIKVCRDLEPVVPRLERRLTDPTQDLRNSQTMHSY
jgi:hypothetical protein